jgi:plastocyanin
MLTSLIAIILATILILSISSSPTAIKVVDGQQQLQEQSFDTDEDDNNNDDDISILSSSVIRTRFGSTYVIGEVRNDMPYIVESVRVIGEFYDSEGRLIDTTSTPTELSQLRPGEKSPFRMIITTDEAVAERVDDNNYNLTVSWDLGVKLAALMIEESERRISRNGNYEIVGEVINTGTHDTEFVKVISTVYDINGRVVRTDITYTDPSDIPAGQSAPFKISGSIQGTSSDDIESIKLIAQSRDHFMIDPELEERQHQENEDNSSSSMQQIQQQEEEEDSVASSEIITTIEGAGTAVEVSTSDESDSSIINGESINITAINQSTAQTIRYTQLAYVAMQNNDTQGVFTNLNLVLDILESIQGNLTLIAASDSISSSDDDNDEIDVSRQTTEEEQQEQEAITRDDIPIGDDNTDDSNDTATSTITDVSIVPDSSSLTDDAYDPTPIQINVGDTITWTNDDSQPHTVTADENAVPTGQFDSGIMAPAATWEHTFDTPSNYSYYCILHPNMVGTVIVVS